MNSAANDEPIKAVLLAAASSRWIGPEDVHSLLGVTWPDLLKIAAAYPSVDGLNPQDVSLAVRGALNYFVNGVRLSEAAWPLQIGCARSAAQRALREASLGA